jgi:hypothetical protein
MVQAYLGIKTRSVEADEPDLLETLGLFPGAVQLPHMNGAAKSLSESRHGQ